MDVNGEVKICENSKKKIGGRGVGSGGGGRGGGSGWGGVRVDVYGEVKRL